MWSWLRQKSVERRWAERRRVLRLITLSVEELPAITISDITGIRSGLLYPALRWLEKNGDVTSRWEVGPSPRRRLYRRAERQGQIT